MRLFEPGISEIYIYKCVDCYCPTEKKTCIPFVDGGCAGFRQDATVEFTCGKCGYKWIKDWDDGISKGYNWEDKRYNSIQKEIDMLLESPQKDFIKDLSELLKKHRISIVDVSYPKTTNKIEIIWEEKGCREGFPCLYYQCLWQLIQNLKNKK